MYSPLYTALVKVTRSVAFFRHRSSAVCMKTRFETREYTCWFVTRRRSGCTP
jgi:hypothetical protein